MDPITTTQLNWDDLSEEDKDKILFACNENVEKAKTWLTTNDKAAIDNLPTRTSPSVGGARRRRKTMKKMSKRKLKKWCKSKKNCRTKMGRKMCKK